LLVDAEIPSPIGEHLIESAAPLHHLAQTDFVERPPDIRISDCRGLEGDVFPDRADEEIGLLLDEGAEERRRLGKDAGGSAKWKVTQGMLEREIVEVRKAKAEQSWEKIGPKRRIGFVSATVIDPPP
jgi:hypothetical protein